MGLEAEQTQFSSLKKNQPHPLISGSTTYSIQVVVGDEARPVKEIGDELFVRLDPGENFSIRLQNDDTRPVLCALYIDGVNTIGRQFQHPLMNPPADRWSLTPGYHGKIDGWLIRGNSDNAQNALQRFRIVPKPQSVAAGFGQSVDGNFGMITAIFYTNGIAGIEPIPTLLAGGPRGGSQFGVGADQADAIKLNFTDSKAGLMLAAMTIHYRSDKELNDLIKSRGNSNQAPVPPPASASKTTTANTHASTTKPMPLPVIPGEDEIFPSAPSSPSGAKK
jgi:hypothetical protein